MLYSLLLAGGKSSRMGQDKSALVYNGRSLLEHSLELLENTGADRVLISGDIKGYDCIPDQIQGAGPLGGLHAALHAIATESDTGLDGSLLLVIPVDMPGLDVESLSRLIVSIGKADSCHYDNEIFPCVFRATEKLLNHLDSLFAESTELGGERSMKALLRVFNELSVSREGLSQEVFLNLNRPEDWEAFRE